MSRKIRLLGRIVPALLFYCALFCKFIYASENLSDIIVYLRDGTYITAKDHTHGLPLENTLSAYDKYMKLKSLNLELLEIYDGNDRHKLDWNQIHQTIYAIELLDSELAEYKYGRMRVTLKNGRNINVINGTLFQYIGHPQATRAFNVFIYDSVHMDWVETYLDISRVKKIVFDPNSLQLPPAPVKAEAAPAEKREKHGPGFETTAEGIKSRLLRSNVTGGDSTVLLKIEFDVNSHNIRTQSYALLFELGKALTSTELKQRNIMIKGHTDSDGTKAYNLKLSKRRANAVKTFLGSNFSIPSTRLKTVGFGETHPLVPNTSRANKQMNRRVEVEAF